MKLTNENIEEIHRDIDQGNSVLDVAQKFGVRIFAIYKILSGTRWGHIAPGRVALEYRKRKADSDKDKSRPILAESGSTRKGGIKVTVNNFWARVDKNGPVGVDSRLGACWIWTGKRNQNGYGVVTSRSIRAHRVAWELYNQRSFPEGLEARHLCGNGSLGCVNPGHVIPGTHQENCQDTARMGRNPFSKKVAR
jgi:hypothetical protein